MAKRTTPLKVVQEVQCPKKHRLPVGYLLNSWTHGDLVNTGGGRMHSKAGVSLGNSRSSWKPCTQETVVKARPGVKHGWISLKRRNGNKPRSYTGREGR